MDNGRYCYDKCCQTKICCICKSHLAPTDIKNARLVPNGMWLCEDCKFCRGCLLFFTRQDLFDHQNLKRQRKWCWHSQCFKCIVCVQVLGGSCSVTFLLSPLFTCLLTKVRGWATIILSILDIMVISHMIMHLSFTKMMIIWIATSIKSLKINTCFYALTLDYLIL